MDVVQLFSSLNSELVNQLINLNGYFNRKLERILSSAERRGNDRYIFVFSKKMESVNSIRNLNSVIWNEICRM